MMGQIGWLISVETMKKLLIFLTFFSISGCAPSYVLLVHLKSGERITCSQPSVFGLRPSTYIIAESRIRDCVKQHEAMGYIRADQLSQEQKAKIIPKSQTIGQDITIRQAPK